MKLTKEIHLLRLDFQINLDPQKKSKGLNSIRRSLDYDILLTSWTPAITDRKEIESYLDEGESYLTALDETVKNVCVGEESGPLDFCRKAISRLGCPIFM